MIQVVRGAEPAELATSRERNIARIAPLLAADASRSVPTRKELGGDYRIAAESLWQSQHFKCAYCEHQEQRARNDVDHHRPAIRADRRPGSAERGGYWWLAWTWENLLFSCRNCNQAGAKHDKFPLDLGSVALSAGESPPGGELPLLIDPADRTLDPRRHIVFRPVIAAGTERWQPFPRDGSRRGATTIEVCRLDRGELVEKYTAHVRDVVRPEVDQLLQTDAAHLDEAWRRFARRILSAHLPFTALACDATEHILAGTRIGSVRVEPWHPPIQAQR